jgi:ABC-type uncharacterized transport system involved in gliding motility auxiliary subunit
MKDSTMFALDQFVLRGGKLIGFVDPKCFIAEAISSQGQNPMQQQQQGMIDGRSNLKKLFDAWGIGFDDDQVVADMSYRSTMMGRVNPTALSLPNEALNKDDRLTKDLQALFMMTPGAFAVSKKDGIEATTLVQSSEVAAKISVADAEKARRENLTNFSPAGRNFAMAVRLTGKFKTAFPDVQPRRRCLERAVVLKRMPMHPNQQPHQPQRPLQPQRLLLLRRQLLRLLLP